VSGETLVGGEFQVNVYTTGYQRHSAVVVDGNGNFVVVWHSLGQDGSGYGVFGRRFDASGVPLGNDFSVNTSTMGGQGYPVVASLAGGGFVVVWTSDTGDGSGSGVFGRRFNAAGVGQASEFQVNSYTTDFQAAPSIASDASGNFVVVWTGGGGQDGNYAGVFGQRFSAVGVAQGSEFRVNSHTTGNQYAAAVASGADGDFVVVWQGPGASDASGVVGQRFNASGVPQGAEFQVNATTAGFQGAAAVAADGSGNFVVVWISPGQDGSSAASSASASTRRARAWATSSGSTPTPPSCRTSRTLPRMGTATSSSSGRAGSTTGPTTASSRSASTPPASPTETSSG
jgi:hypothetical protein